MFRLKLMQCFPIKEKEEKYLRAAIRRQGNPRLPAGTASSPGIRTRDAETKAFHVLFYLYEFTFT
ncbi:hypothetical protein C5O10_07185 [Akkermansia muciniphila]|nr:hypothetical protein C5O09_07140 [Akkermansia muciniphila]QHV16606.1 hypothetical protein C5O10_07185 [Akkermansia muciniphila]